MGIDQERQRGHQHQRREILVHAEGQVGHEGWVDADVAGGAKKDGVPIGWGLGHQVGPQHTGHTGFVVDDDRLPQGLRQFRCNRAGHDINAAPWREANHDAHRFGGERLRPDRCEGHGQTHGHHQAGQQETARLEKRHGDDPDQ